MNNHPDRKQEWKGGFDAQLYMDRVNSKYKESTTMSMSKKESKGQWRKESWDHQGACHRCHPPHL